MGWFELRPGDLLLVSALPLFPGGTARARLDDVFLYLGHLRGLFTSSNLNTIKASTSSNSLNENGFFSFNRVIADNGQRLVMITRVISLLFPT